MGVAQTSKVILSARLSASCLTATKKVVKKVGRYIHKLGCKLQPAGVDSTLLVVDSSNARQWYRLGGLITTCENLFSHQARSTREIVTN